MTTTENGTQGAPLPLDEIRDLSGLEQLRGLIAGKFLPPPFSITTRVFITEADEGRVVFEGEPAADFISPNGTVHGGWTAGLLDSAMACAVHSRLAVGQVYTTLELKVNYVRPVTAKIARVRCEGRVLSFGNRIATAEG